MRGLQIRVLNISQAAAEDRMDGALAALESLEQDLDAAARQGLLSLARYRGIEAAVAAVRKEISGQLAAVSAAAAEPPTTAAPATPAAPPDVEPVAPPAPVIAQVPAPVPAEEGPDSPDAAKESKGKGKTPGKP